MRPSLDNEYSMPRVSIIILNWNGKSLLGGLLDESIDSAINQTYRNVEVIFADNGSTDNSIDHVKNKYGNKVKIIVLDRNYGFCLGNNLAVRYVSKETKYVLFQNPDAILAPDYVEKLVGIMGKNPKIAALQGLEIRPQNKKYGSIGGTLSKAGYSRKIRSSMIYNSLLYLETLIAFGAALLVRLDVFKKLVVFHPTTLCIMMSPISVLGSGL